MAKRVDTKRPSQATDVTPLTRLVEESAKGGTLPNTAVDYGFAEPGKVRRGALVPVLGNSYSVPVEHVGAPVTVRVHRQRIVIWRDAELLAEHRRAPDGEHRRVIEPAHFAPVFGRKPRARVMLYREVLLDLGDVARTYLSELSHRQRRRNGSRQHPKVLRRNRMSDTSAGNGKVVVNRAMSLDGFIAGPGHAMNWIFDFMAPDAFPEIAAATGAMLIGRRTYEVAKRQRDAAEPGGKEYGGGWSGPVFVLTHRPPEPPDPAAMFLTGDIGEAVATARSAACGKNLEILGTDVAGQCLRRGLVDEILVYVLPVLLGDGIRFSSPGLGRIDLEPVSSTRSGAVTILRFRVRK